MAKKKTMMARIHLVCSVNLGSSSELVSERKQKKKRRILVAVVNLKCHSSRNWPIQ